MPILYSLQQNKDLLFFVDKENVFSEKNTTTIITGKNSVGKSRLLRSIIIDCLKKDKFERIIALSNTQYHKFPRYLEISSHGYRLNKYKRLAFESHPFTNESEKTEKTDLHNFIYNFFEKNKIAPFSSAGNFTDLELLKCLQYFILNLSNHEKPFLALEKVLDFLGLDKFIKFDIRVTYRHINALPSEKLPNILKVLEESIKNNDSFTPSELNKLIELKESLKFAEEKTFSLFETSICDLKKLSPLLDFGLCKIFRVNFSKKKQLINYKDLSSGEIAVLSLLLGLSSELVNNSLVCIDEPELNLHPEWQEKIIQLIELVASFYSGCHFFIATHSPQLLSGVTNDNTYILDLSKNKLFNIKNYKNRSSDFQLSEIFNFPGNNNEYLIRKLLIILNKQNTEDDYVLDEESRSMLNNIKDMINQKKIHEEDKVKILFDLLEDF